jgi:hypothetical protein
VVSGEVCKQYNKTAHFQKSDEMRAYVYHFDVLWRKTEIFRDWMTSEIDLH